MNMKVCKNCPNCNESYCRVFKRPVDEDFNRCAHYDDPFAKTFVVSKNLEIIMKAEEEVRKKHYNGYLAEEAKLREALLIEMEKEKQQKRKTA